MNNIIIIFLNVFLFLRVITTSFLWVIKFSLLITNSLVLLSNETYISLLGVFLFSDFIVSALMNIFDLRSSPKTSYIALAPLFFRSLLLKIYLEQYCSILGSYFMHIFKSLYISVNDFFTSSRYVFINSLYSSKLNSWNFIILNLVLND